MLDIHYVVFGTHEYEWALVPFAHFFRRYWGGRLPVYVGDRIEDGLPEGMEFVRVPAYVEGVWPWEHWFGSGVMSYLETVQEPLAAIFLPDHWLTAPVDHRAVEALAGYMLAHPEALRGNLTAGTGMDSHGAVVEARDGYQIVGLGPDHPHFGFDGGVTFCPSLWQPGLLCQLLEGGWSLWECERLGTQRMCDRRGDLRAVGVRPGPVHRIHALRHDQHWTAVLSGMGEEDRAVARRMVPAGWEVAE